MKRPWLMLTIIATIAITVVSMPKPALAQVGNSVEISLSLNESQATSTGTVHYIVIVTNNAAILGAHNATVTVTFYPPGPTGALGVYGAPIVLDTNVLLNMGDAIVYNFDGSGALPPNTTIKSRPVLSISLGAIPMGPSVDVAYAALHFDAQYIDSPPYNGSGDKNRSLTIIRPSTIVTITAAATSITSGTSTNLTITESNTGNVSVDSVSVFLVMDPIVVPLINNGSVAPSVTTAFPVTLNNLSPSFSSNQNGDNTLAVAEIWTWTLNTGNLINSTNFIATGTGMDPLGNAITYPAYPSEQAKATITVISLATKVIITPAADTIMSGTSTNLTVTESNIGQVALSGGSVMVFTTPTLAGFPMSLDNYSFGFSSNQNYDSTLGIGEIWTWTLSTGNLVTTTVFTAIGQGTDPLGERDQTTVTVINSVPSTLEIVGTGSNSDNHMVTQTGNLYNFQGTLPMQTAFSSSKLAWVWLTRNNQKAENVKIEWFVEQANGSGAIISPISSLGNSGTLGNISITEGILTNSISPGKVDSPERTHAVSYSRAPTELEKRLFSYWFDKLDPELYAVSAIEICSSLYAVVSLDVFVQGSDGATLNRNTLIDFNDPDPAPIQDWGIPSTLQIIGTNPLQNENPNTRMVIQTGELTYIKGTYPMQTAFSSSKLAWIWLTRNNQKAENVKIEWFVEQAKGNGAIISPISSLGNSGTLGNISITEGILTNSISPGKVDNPKRTYGISHSRAPTESEKQLFLLWFPTLNPENYAVSAAEIYSSLYDQISFNIFVHDSNGAVINRNTILDFSDPPHGDVAPIQDWDYLDRPSLTITPSSTTIPPGGTFSANVNIDKIANLASWQYAIEYNPAVLKVIGDEGGNQGVTTGLINGTIPVPVSSWSFSPVGTQGAAIILQYTAGLTPLSGSGYLAQVHFQVLPGSANQSSFINFIDLPGATPPFSRGLFDNLGNTITGGIWTNGSVSVVSRGDANGDRVTNMADVIMVERIILGLSPSNQAADANGDGIINIGDIIKIERIILGLQ